MVYKYQKEFAGDLRDSWINGNREYVRTTIRNLKNKAQAAYIAAYIATLLGEEEAVVFCEFIHPNH